LYAGETVYGASLENGGSSSPLTSDQVRQNNLTEAARNNDTMGNNNFREGTMNTDLLEDVLLTFLANTFLSFIY
jgi:hypothetical protein